MWSRSTAAFKSDDGQTFTANYAAAYQVEHTADATNTEILTATGIPQLRSSHPEAAAVFCNSVGPQESVGPVFSIVPVTWQGELSSDDPDDDPTNKPPEISFGSVTSTEELDEDINGQPLTNSVGETVTGISDEIWDYVLKVKRNFRTFSSYAWRQYARSYSNDVFFDNWPAGTASLRGFNVNIVNYGTRQVYFETTANITFREPYNTVNARAWWKRYRNEGLYTRSPSVTFSGGGGTGAAAYPIVSSSNTISAIAVTARGSDYTSAPTVTISGGGGTGATATAVLTNGQVTSVTVDTAGSGYKSTRVRAVDDNKEPITQPILLTAAGQKLENTEEAVWIERPTRRAMPYRLLGLL